MVEFYILTFLCFYSIIYIEKHLKHVHEDTSKGGFVVEFLAILTFRRPLGLVRSHRIRQIQAPVPGTRGKLPHHMGYPDGQSYQQVLPGLRKDMEGGVINNGSPRRHSRASPISRLRYGLLRFLFLLQPWRQRIFLLFLEVF